MNPVLARRSALETGLLVQDQPLNGEARSVRFFFLLDITRINTCIG